MLRLLTAALAVLFSLNANAQTYKIATNDRGSAFFDISTALHRALNQSSGISLQQVTFPGLPKMLVKADSGEFDFLVGNSVDLGLGFRGPGFKVGGKNPYEQSKNIRLVARGTTLTGGLFVRKDSPIKTMQDLKGKRLAGEFPDHLAIWFNAYGYLSSAGMSWNDVKVVPVKNSNDGIKALIEGKVDGTNYALNASKIKDADGLIGIKAVPLDCSADGLARLRKAVPGYDGMKMKKGDAIGLLEDQCVLVYDVYLVATKSADPKAVTTIAKALFENSEKVSATAPIMKDWVSSRAVNPNVTIPYHPAAVEYYKAKGVWTPAMDEAQKKLIEAAN
jgi:TRAP transporter TAXI family solute receptor